ncbi:hypothetical protein [Bacteroides acidifaciens]|uniref:hypothetical protein n=1 Tax=Bacteroides acidifaciens TaxID=85831 RepID=UPI0030142C6B
MKNRKKYIHHFHQTVFEQQGNDNTCAMVTKTTGMNMDRSKIVSSFIILWLLIFCCQM